MEINKKVPSLKLPGTSGLEFNLSDYKDHYLVIYFYPKDATPGCTTQGVDFRDAYKKFQALNTEVLGISRDTLKSHENFKAKFTFPFELLSDEEEEACELFGVIKMKNMFEVIRTKVEVIIMNDNYDKIILQNKKNIYWEIHLKIIIKKYDELLKLLLWKKENDYKNIGLSISSFGDTKYTYHILYIIYSAII